MAPILVMGLSTFAVSPSFPNERLEKQEASPASPTPECRRNEGLTLEQARRRMLQEESLKGVPTEERAKFLDSLGQIMSRKKDRIKYGEPPYALAAENPAPEFPNQRPQSGKEIRLASLLESESVPEPLRRELREKLSRIDSLSAHAEKTTWEVSLQRIRFKAR